MPVCPTKKKYKQKHILNKASGYVSVTVFLD